MQQKRSVAAVPVKPLLMLALLVLVPALFEARTADGTVSVWHAPVFGDVTIYARDRQPDSVVLLVSGDDTDGGVVEEMATQLRSWGALVAVIDGARYDRSVRDRARPCADPAADLDELNHALRRHMGVAPDMPPALIGYGMGALLVYAAAARASPGAFASATSIGFCPRWPLDVPLCPEPGSPAPATSLAPKADLAMPWILLHGAADTVCPIDGAREFAAGISSAKVVTMPAIGHRLGDPAQWLDAFRDAYLKLGTATSAAATLPAEVGDLPLVEVPATSGTSQFMALLLTGDGGWAGLDRGVSDRLAASGVPVVALSTLRYFWAPQQPEHVARDLERIMGHYLKAWQKQRVLLIGYSFGANVLPFAVAEMTDTFRARVATLNLLGLARHTGFEIHVADWVPGSEPEGVAIAPQFDKLVGLKTLCIYGADETDSLCPALPTNTVRAIEMPGDHHFDDDTASLARHIVDFAGSSR